MTQKSENDGQEFRAGHAPHFNLLFAQKNCARIYRSWKRSTDVALPPARCIIYSDELLTAFLGLETALLESRVNGKHLLLCRWSSAAEIAAGRLHKEQPLFCRETISSQFQAERRFLRQTSIPVSANPRRASADAAGSGTATPSAENENFVAELPPALWVENAHSMFVGSNPLPLTIPVPDILRNLAF
jgi:hypothetical protein